MLTEPTMLKIEGAKQMAKVATMAGKTYTVVPSSAGAMGLAKWITLTPVNAGATSSVTIKLEGTRQMAAANNLAGKNVFIDPSPTLIGGQTSKFLVMTPVNNASAVSAAQLPEPSTLVQLEGARQAAQVSKFIGKTVTVVPAPNVAQANGMVYFKPAGGQASVGIKVQDANAMGLSSMNGKSYTIAKAPMATGNVTGNWLLFKPTAQATATTSMVGTEQMPPVPDVTALPQMQNIALKTPIDPATATATGTAVSGTIWNGGGMSLGLGLGLGVAGPVILGAALVGTGYGSWLAYKKYKAKKSAAETAGAQLEGELDKEEGNFANATDATPNPHTTAEAFPA
ncbi:conserved hypothetical protein [Magnetococcus marinus MC-1]|uniref:Uncharacterized protein n=1 Tax=Magnetococcus marinus (strain ATCC BAA-1437 / JCM 17883 / MC-1) TaxID=156889 RepID=A0L9U5_MAGMM|nr:magnetosome protein MamD [Magnetococcus marinus]ABK44738.1 conserved hypothetical protein [Magnetococcus marinus MC-1]